MMASACSEPPMPPADAAPSPADAAIAPPPPPPERVVRVLRGIAIWYGGKWHGRRTASGERFDKHAFTAAHRSLPLGSRVRITDLNSGRKALVRINDRGPYGRDRRRIIDVSEAVARELGFLERGSTRVQLEVLAPPLIGPPPP
jgi:rare lipoprotein A